MFKILFVLICGFIFGAVVVENKQYFNKMIASPVAFLPDGGEYDGGLLKGELSGNGRIVWPDGRHYEGEFKKGLFHGKGYYKGKQYSYEGDFVEGIAKGKGKIIFEDGRTYIGEVDNGEANGQGVMTLAVGEYIGEFKHNQFHGDGKLARTNGDIYEGEFAEGLFHGAGLFSGADGKIFKGEFKKGAINGNGDYRDGEIIYTGQFKQWLFDGVGDYKDKAQTYKGEFVEGEFHGKGEYINNQNGEHYIGDFVDGLYHGQGILKTNGERYEGAFEYGKKHGQGVLTYEQPLDGVTEVKGDWRYGSLLYSDNPLVEYNTGSIVEDVLYRQSERVKQSLSIIEENDLERTELYFVGVAGDGSKGVFRREINFVKDQFDRDYGTKGKSFLLINSNVSYKTTPLATVTSIEMVLKGVAEKMDVENDILFIYLTGTGSSDFDFLLKQPGLELSAMSAANLGSIVRSLPVRHKVVVISSCYSSGYVEPVKDDNTMLIVSFSADKASVDCENTVNMTYFGEAFFKDALPKTASFVDAFDRARDIIKGREAKDNVKNSNPLIFKPQSIRKQLALWRKDLSQWQLEQNKIIE